MQPVQRWHHGKGCAVHIITAQPNLAPDNRLVLRGKTNFLVAVHHSLRSAIVTALERSLWARLGTCHTAILVLLFAGKEPKKWTAGSVPTPMVPATAVATSTTTTPEQRQEHAMARFTQLRDDPKAVESLLKETTDNLLSAERLIGYLQSSRRLAQSGRDATKATMVATNSNLLKVLHSYPASRYLCDIHAF